MHPLTNSSILYKSFIPILSTIHIISLLIAIFNSNSIYLSIYIYITNSIQFMEVVLRLVETPPYYEPPPLQQHSDSSRPTLGFPLGTALLLIIIFSLSGFFSCCYHWDKLRHLRGSDLDSDQSNSKSNAKSSEKKEIEKQSLPVIMPGDRIAKFIALPCPCEPPREVKITVEQVPKPPKPPHIVVPMY